MSSINVPQPQDLDADVVTINTTDSGLGADANVQDTEPQVDDDVPNIEVDVGMLFPFC